jgi:hypothetical protein
MDGTGPIFRYLASRLPYYFTLVEWNTHTRPFNRPLKSAARVMAQCAGHPLQASAAPGDSYICTAKTSSRPSAFLPTAI